MRRWGSSSDSQIVESNRGGLVLDLDVTRKDILYQVNANLVDAIKEMFDDTKEHLDYLFEITKYMPKKDLIEAVDGADKE